MIDKNQAERTKANRKVSPSMYGSIVQPGKDLDEIYMIGSKILDVLAGFQIYDVKTNKWKNNEKALKSLYDQSKQKETVVNPTLSNAYLINPSLNHDDAPQMKLYYFGGKYKI